MTVHQSAKQIAPAALRNAAPIGDVLARILPPRGLVLEIASGSGTHAAAFAERFTHLTWQPSDADATARASIAAHVADLERTNIAKPLMLDVMRTPWPVASADAVVCINMIHISPWAATVALFQNAAVLLAPGAPLFTYGPYILHGDFISDSNVEFDESLKERNPAWGLREVESVAAVAARFGFTPPEIVAMPANNLSLVFRKI